MGSEIEALLDNWGCCWSREERELLRLWLLLRLLLIFPLVLLFVDGGKFNEEVLSRTRAINLREGYFRIDDAVGDEDEDEDEDEVEDEDEEEEEEEEREESPLLFPVSPFFFIIFLRERFFGLQIKRASKRRRR